MSREMLAGWRKNDREGFRGDIRGGGSFNLNRA